MGHWVGIKTHVWLPVTGRGIHPMGRMKQKSSSWPFQRGNIHFTVKEIFIIHITVKIGWKCKTFGKIEMPPLSNCLLLHRFIGFRMCFSMTDQLDTDVWSRLHSGVISVNALYLRGHPFMTSTRRGEEDQAQVDACGRGERSPAPCGRPQRKLKSTDVILFSSHAKKLASFLPEFCLWTEKSGNFSAIEINDINY